MSDHPAVRPTRFMLVGTITIKPEGGHWSEVEIRPESLQALVIEDRGTLTYWVPELPPFPIEITFQAAGGKETKVRIENAEPIASPKAKSGKPGKPGKARMGEFAIRRDVTLISGPRPT